MKVLARHIHKRTRMSSRKALGKNCGVDSPSTRRVALGILRLYAEELTATTTVTTIWCSDEHITGLTRELQDRQQGNL